jgi:hypothetical protein
MDVVHFSLDDSAVREVLAEVNQLLELDLALDFDGGELRAEVSGHIVHLREHPAEAFCIDNEPVTTGRAADCRVRLKPSDQLVKFVLALRALKRELGVGVSD